MEVGSPDINNKLIGGTQGHEYVLRNFNMMGWLSEHVLTI